MNNAVNGETMENVYKGKDVRIVTGWANRGKRPGDRTLVSRYSFHSTAHFTNGMVAIQLERVHTLYNLCILMFLCFRIIQI